MLRLVFVSVSFLAVMGCQNTPNSDSGGGVATHNLPPSAVTNPFATQSFKLGAMGDSISRGYNISGLYVESLNLNWSTGEALATSQIGRLQGKFGAQGWSVQTQTINVAEVGEAVLATSSTLTTQAATLALFAPYYVTLQIGANDVCQGYVSSVAARSQLRDRVVAALRILTQSGNPPKAVLITSVPRLWRLREISTLANNSYCQLAWSLLCPNMAVGQASFEQQWAWVNQALLEAAVMVGGPVVYDGNLAANTQLELPDISMQDCFHPSSIGQARLSAAAWTAIEPKLNQLFGF